MKCTICDSEGCQDSKEMLNHEKTLLGNRVSYCEEFFRCLNCGFEFVTSDQSVVNLEEYTKSLKHGFVLRNDYPFIQSIMWDTHHDTILDTDLYYYLEKRSQYISLKYLTKEELDYIIYLIRDVGQGTFLGRVSTRDFIKQRLKYGDDIVHKTIQD